MVATRGAGLYSFLPVTVTARTLYARLRRIPGGAAWAKCLAAVDGGALRGSSLALTIPFWVNDLMRSPLPPSTVLELVEIQARLISAGLLHDALMDGHGCDRSAVAALLPLLSEAHWRLSKFFPARDPFWNQYHRLTALQARHAKWELSVRVQPGPRFGTRFVNALGCKAALLRWPVFAAATMARKPRRAARLDAVISSFLEVLQLLDDLADARSDESENQCNAVVCAARRGRENDAHPDLALLRGARTVCDWTGTRIDRMISAADARSGFARLCRFLQERVRVLARIHERRMRLLLISEALAPFVDRSSPDRRAPAANR